MSDKPIYVEAMEVIAELKVIAKEKAGEIAALKAERDSLKGEAAAWEKSFNIEWEQAEKLTAENEILKQNIQMHWKQHEEMKAERGNLRMALVNIKMLHHPDTDAHQIAQAALKEVDT